MRFLAGLLAVLFGISDAQAQAPESLATAVLAFAASRGETQAPPFRHALTDLNGDKQQDAVVLLLGPSWCGSGGCTLLVFKGGKGRFALVSSTSVTLEPIRQAGARAGGWSDLIVHSRGRGDVVMRHDGRKYPGNPSRLKPASPAQIAGARALIE
jgi:hypothetical protein